MRKLFACLVATSVALTFTADGASAYYRHHRYSKYRTSNKYRTFNHATVSVHEGIPRYGRTGSTFPPTGTPTGHENAAPIGDTQQR
jgi:hypothetical protein